MASKAVASIALLLALNLLFLSMVSATTCPQTVNVLASACVTVGVFSPGPTCCGLLSADTSAEVGACLCDLISVLKLQIAIDAALSLLHTACVNVQVPSSYVCV